MRAEREPGLLRWLPLVVARAGIPYAYTLTIWPAGALCVRRAGQLGPSHVLTAMGFPPERVRGAVRFSASFLTTRDEIGHLADLTDRAVRLLRPAVPVLRAEWP